MDALRTESDVSAHFLTPLFVDTLGYPRGELELAKKVTGKFGRRTLTGFADLVAHYKGEPVVTIEAKKPTEPVRSGLDQVDSYANALKPPYSVVTNGRQFVLRGYFSFNSRINVIDDTVEVLAHEQWKKVKGPDRVR